MKIMNKEFFLGAIYPFLILIEGTLLVNWLPFSTTNVTMPFLQICYSLYLLLISIYRSFSISFSFLSVLAINLILFLYSILFPDLFSLSIIFNILISVLMLLYLFSNPHCHLFLRGVFYSFILIIILIYVIRIGWYGLDFYRLRGGVNIWSGWVIPLGLILIAIEIKRFNKINLGVFFCCALVSILFMSRLHLILIGVLFATIFFFQFSNRLRISSIGILFLLMLILGNDYILKLTDRFHGVDPEVFNIESLSPHRWELIQISLDYIKNNLLGGGFLKIYDLNPYGYTSSHNFLIDIMLENGIILFGFVLGHIIIVSSLSLSMLLKSSSFNNFFLFFLIPAIFSLLTIGGGTLIQATGYTNPLLLVYFQQLLLGFYAKSKYP